MSLHVMLDLETLAKSPMAMVSEVGYCVFDPDADEIEYHGGWFLNLQEQMFKRELDIDTVQWWLVQEETARKKMAMPAHERFLFNDFWQQFTELDWPQLSGVWSHGLTFDLPILMQLAAQNQREIPWHYRTPRDTRTIFWLAGMGINDLVLADVKHSARADAVAQAKSVQKAYQIIRHKQYPQKEPS